MSVADVDYFKKYDRIMFTATGQLYTRLLGQNMLHVPVEEIYGYWAQVAEQKPEMIQQLILEVDKPRSLEFMVKGYVLGEGLTMDFRVWGLKGGRNTIFTRVGWWKLRLLERAKVMTLKLLPRIAPPSKTGFTLGE